MVFWSPRNVTCMDLEAMDSRLDISGDESKVFELIEDLKRNSTDVQRAATAELRLLARHRENRMVIANCGAISLLVGLLHSTDPKTQENAVTALLNLSLSDNKIAIANAYAIDPLIHVLKTGNPEAQENSAATLLSLSVTEENKLQIGRSGAIGPLVELLANGTLRGKKDAVSALYNLSTSRENKVRIVQAGAMSHLVELMNPATGMVDKAVAVLANLATIPEGRNAIGQNGGIFVLVEVVELGSARGKENAAAALLQMCKNSGRFCSLVLQEGAVPPLVALSQFGTPRAKEKARALLNCFQNQGYLHSGRSTFKKKAPEAIKEIKKFAQNAMGTTDVRVDVKLNKHIWSRGIRSVPRRVRVRIARKRNDEEDAKEELYSLVTVSEVPSEGFKGLGTKMSR
ncbi:U-box domain-containing protein [Musa troglodytarum]|uniref:RING-type E3 ubiquitin transferase n=1 Tax=Musa troglodytarum TaxID=320322 RepID=A0A9E7HNC3_9LILI|nr:U-box domain-containing protein [Musa troglodytarum]